MGSFLTTFDGDFRRHFGDDGVIDGSTPTVTATDADPPTAPVFAHASEAELARILDYYQVEWRLRAAHLSHPLQPRRGRRESFAPDPYLPEFDLYRRD